MMFTYNFKRRFTPLVLQGTKYQTIRMPRKDGRKPKPGDALRFYEGMRTKNCWHVADAVCLHVQPVSMYLEHDGYAQVISYWPNGPDLDFYDEFEIFEGDQLEIFARLDGFKDSCEMFQFFLPPGGGELELDVIYWLPESVRPGKGA
jgi:hypothetical protein